MTTEIALKKDGLAKRENKCEVIYSDKMELRIPMVELRQCHQAWGPQLIQAELDKGYILDGEMYEDFANDCYVVPLRKL